MDSKDVKTESEKVIRHVINTINCMDYLNAVDASTRKQPSEKHKIEKSRHDEWSCQCGAIKGILYRDSTCSKCGTIVKELDLKYGYIIDVESSLIEEEE